MHMRDQRHERGFTLTELAVVFAIVSLLLAAGLYTLSAQTDQRNFEETRQRIEAARSLLLAFAVANGRLPCPATSTSAGDEAPAGGGTCTGAYPSGTGGFLPARAIGFQITDAGGYAVDAWGNRIRYAVSAGALTGCAGTSSLPHFTSATNLRLNGLTCQPNDLVVCRTATGITSTTCGASPPQPPLTNQTTVVAVIFATGKTGNQGTGGADEAANLNGDGVFVWHTPNPAGPTNGEFDHQMTWITAGELYGRLVAAGLLP
ncbi:MAG TPA: type II secretion system protein [Burkholderiales bacterium]|nr:type II secretion system protein [Burkholderiales bacterium]